MRDFLSTGLMMNVKKFGTKDVMFPSLTNVTLVLMYVLIFIQSDNAALIFIN